MAIVGLVSGKVASVGQSKLSKTGTDVDFSSQPTSPEARRKTKLSEGGGSLSQQISDLDLTAKGSVTAETAGALVGARPADLDVPTAKGTVGTSSPADDITLAQPKGAEKTYDREHILKNLEESKLARESSTFDDYLRKEYAQRGKYFAERISWGNDKYAYLSKDIDKATGKPTPVRYRSYLKADGAIDWPLQDGFVLDSAGNPITQPANLKVGDIIDRFGESGGTFTSPVKEGEIIPFNKRGLPYPEGYQTYHQYEIVKEINLENVKMGYEGLSKPDKMILEKLMGEYKFSLKDIAEPKEGMIDIVFGQGGGTQLKFGTSISW